MGARKSLQNSQTKGPASVGALPDHGSNIPGKENAVNDSTDTTAPAETAIDEARLREFAATEFDAWTKRDDEVPMQDGLRDLQETWFPIIGLATATMYKTKSELVAFCRDQGDMADRFCTDIDTVFEKLDALSQIMSAARDRLVIAHATVWLESTR